LVVADYRRRPGVTVTGGSPRRRRDRAHRDMPWIALIPDISGVCGIIGTFG
jgi:hypothetical protein